MPKLTRDVSKGVERKLAAALYTILTTIGEMESEDAKALLAADPWTRRLAMRTWIRRLIMTATIAVVGGGGPAGAGVAAAYFVFQTTYYETGSAAPNRLACGAAAPHRTPLERPGRLLRDDPRPLGAVAGRPATTRGSPAAEAGRHQGTRSDVTEHPASTYASRRQSPSPCFTP